MTYGDNDILTRVSCFVKGFCFDVSLLICTHILKEIKPLKTMLTDTCGFLSESCCVAMYVTLHFA